MICPRCGGEYLHQEKVTVYEREEDDPITCVTQISLNSVETNNEMSVMSGNPSARRNGLRITFSCEFCHDIEIDLTIEQHKGNTFLNWDYIDK